MSDYLTLWAKKIDTLEKENLGWQWEIQKKNNTIEQLKKEKQYTKTIIQDLLNNSDEYARQRAYDFLEEVNK